MKIEYNIKQHESCNIFIKSNPTICDLFAQYKQIFINYFHVSDIIYLRLHEPTPLWYETVSDDLTPLSNNFINERELTLITCNNTNKKRFIVKALLYNESEK